MKCDVLTCANHDDCVILDITNKKPKDHKSCSYFKTQVQVDKKEDKKTKDAEKPKRKYIKKKE